MESNNEQSVIPWKDTNPKDAMGTRRMYFSVIPMNVLNEVAASYQLHKTGWGFAHLPIAVVAELGLGMTEGSCKYGRHNYRVAGIRASIYFDATMRHLNWFLAGEDIDPDSGLSHITKAICSLTVFRDAQLNNMWLDDRPPMAKGQLKKPDLSNSPGSETFQITDYLTMAYYYLMRFWEDGYDNDILSALVVLFQLRDLQIRKLVIDDRPKPTFKHLNSLKPKLLEILDRYPDPKPAFTQENTVEHRNLH